MKILVAISGALFAYAWERDVASALVEALAAAGHEAELVFIPFTPRPAAAIPDQMLACRLLDFSEAAGRRIDRLIALNFPACLVPHPHKIVWLLDYPCWDLDDDPAGPVVQAAIRRAHRALLAEAKSIYAFSANVARRVGFPAPALPAPPADAALFRGGPAGDYFYCPDASLEAMVMETVAGCREKVTVRFAGASGESRRDAYAHCLAVIVRPGEEEGYHALEAMLSAKPVVAGGDAAAMDKLWADRRCAQALGAAARARYDSLLPSWERVLERLLA